MFIMSFNNIFDLDYYDKNLRFASFKNTNIRKPFFTKIFLHTIWKPLSKFLEMIIKLLIKVWIFWRKLKNIRWSDLGRLLTSANSGYWLNNSSIFFPGVFYEIIYRFAPFICEYLRNFNLQTSSIDTKNNLKYIRISPKCFHPDSATTLLK
jgi:hypothetical protein